MTARRTRLVRKLALVVAVVALVLGAAELGLRAFAVPLCGVTPFRPSDLPGVSAELRPGFETLYKGVRVRINSLGCRGPEVPPREEGVLRVALVGDSMTFGSSLELDDTLAVSLERALAGRGRRAQVVNFGVPGYCAGNVASVVEHRALPIEPDVVLYVFYANDGDPPDDWTEIPPDARIDELHAYPYHSALLEWVNVEVKELALRFGKRLTRRTPQWSRLEYERGGGERVRAALRRMRDACAAAGVRFLVADYPHMTAPALNPFRPIDELAAADAAALGIDWFDLAPVFAGEGTLRRFQAGVFDHHPNGAANRRVAEWLVERVWP